MGSQCFNYDSYDGAYQFNAMHYGNKIQRFWHREKLDIMLSVLDIQRSNLVVDLGCGSGNATFMIASRAKRVIGLDISDSALRFCNKRKGKNGFDNVEFRKIKKDKLPLSPGIADCVIFSEVIEHLEINKYSRILKQISRILKPNGKLFITTPNYRSPWPIVEFVIDSLNLTPPMKGEQHISKFNPITLRNELERHNLKVEKMGSFYLFSPFINLLSANVAICVLNLELRIDLLPGMLIYAVCQKE